MDAKTIGDNIKKYRKEKGYTLKQLSEKINRDYNTIRLYECGKVIPRPYARLALAIALDISINDLIR